MRAGTVGRGARLRRLLILHAASSAICGAVAGLWALASTGGSFGSAWTSVAQVAFGLGFPLVGLLGAALAWPKSDAIWRAWRWLAPAAAPLAVCLFLSLLRSAA